jgi:hypothetical protein
VLLRHGKKLEYDKIGRNHLLEMTKKDVFLAKRACFLAKNGAK